MNAAQISARMADVLARGGVHLRDAGGRVVVLGMFVRVATSARDSRKVAHLLGAAGFRFLGVVEGGRDALPADPDLSRACAPFLVADELAGRDPFAGYCMVFRLREVPA